MIRGLIGILIFLIEGGNIIRTNKILLIIALIFVSVVAISAVSATSDLIDSEAIADANDGSPLTTDSGLDDVIADGDGGTTPGEGGDTPGEGGTTPSEGGTTPSEGGTTPSEGGTTPSEGGTTPSEGGTTPSEGGSTIPGMGNGTGRDNSTFNFNFTGLGGNGTGSFDLGGILSMFMGGGNQDTIQSADLKTYYAKTTTYKVQIMNGKNNATKGSVIFTVDGKDYIGHVNSKGYASVNLKKLKPGKHYIFIEYGQTVVKNFITVKKSIITKNVVKKAKKAKNFRIKILNKKGKAFKKQTVKIKFRGKTFTKKTNKKGLAFFKIPKNLKVGKYTIKTIYAGLTVKNKITVNA